MENPNKIFNMVLIQLKVIHDRKINLERCLNMIESAVELHQPKIVVLPEYFTTPTNLRNLENYIEDEEDSETLKIMQDYARKYNIYIVMGTIPTYSNSDKSKIYNTCFCINNFGEVKTTFKKLHLFDVEIPGKIKFKESSKITPGNEIGVFETEFGKIGIGICYDIRFPEYSLLLRKEYEIDMLIFPAAFNTTTGPLHWELLGRSRAIDNNVYVIMCSPGRNHENPKDYQAWGHSQIIDPFGQVVSSTGYEEDFVFAKVDLNKNDEMREGIPVWKQKRWDLYNISFNK